MSRVGHKTPADAWDQGSYALDLGSLFLMLWKEIIPP